MNNVNGDVPVTQVVVQMKAMGMQEKSRIEKLIDTRAKALTSYLSEMKDFAYQANDSTEFVNAEDLTDIKKNLAQIAIDRERINGLRKGEVDAVEQVLTDQLEGKLQKLQDLAQRLKHKKNEEVQAAADEIDGKFRDQEDQLVERETGFKLDLEALVQQETREKLIRQIALANSFSRLEDGIADTRNLAVEKLYTEVIRPDDAKTVLGLLPDATQFRDRVSPERLFQVFNDRLSRKTLPLDKAVCKHCGSDKLKTHERGEIYCRDCGSYDVLDASVKKLIALPSIQEIAMEGRLEALKPTPEPMHTGGLRAALEIPTVG